jgi:hypothetical protein
VTPEKTPDTPAPAEEKPAEEKPAARPAVRPPADGTPAEPAVDPKFKPLEEEKEDQPTETLEEEAAKSEAPPDKDAKFKPLSEEEVAKEKAKRAFVKGELASFIGSTKLVTKNNRIGVRLGYRQLDLVHYVTLNPEADMRFGKLEFGLGVPLALEIFNGEWDEAKDEPVGFDDAGSLRTEDWDEPGEYVRFIRYLRYGKKEDRLYFNLSQVASTSIGHGALMRRYSVNIDPDSTRLSAELDMYNDYAGFEIVTNSVVDWDLFGGIAFVKPLSFFMDSPVARSLSIGFTYLADRHAPVTLTTQTDPTVNPYWVLGTGRPEVSSDAFLHGMGVDMEIKILKTENVDLKPFIDYSWFMPSDPSGGEFEPDGGGGLTIGLLGRLNYGRDPVHALRTIAEFRYFSATYLPGYFDTFYEIQRFISSQRYRSYAQDTAGLPPSKFTDVFHNRKEDDSHLGFYLEFNYAIVEYLALTLALEGSDAEGGNHFLAHLEVPALSWLQFFASYHQRSMEGLSDLFSSSGNDKNVFAAARLRALPFLFINFRYFYTFELNDGYADLDRPDRQYRYYDNIHGWMADFELGWEF